MGEPMTHDEWAAAETSRWEQQMSRPLAVIDLGELSPAGVERAKAQVAALIAEVRAQPVYELIFMTDEAYYTVGHFALKEDAEKVAAIGNARIEQRDRDLHLGLQVKERGVLTGSNWTVDQIKEVLEDQGPDFGDWFLPEIDDDEA